MNWGQILGTCDELRSNPREGFFLTGLPWQHSTSSTLKRSSCCGSLTTRNWGPRPVGMCKGRFSLSRIYLRLVDADERSQPCRSKLAGVYQVFDLTYWVKGLEMNILSKHSISFKERLVFHGLLEMRATADLIDHLLVSKKFYAADKNFRPFALHCLLKLLWRELHKGAISRRDKLWQLWKCWTDLWSHQHLDTIF